MCLQKVIRKKKLEKKLFLVASLRSLTKRAGSGSGSVSQWYGTGTKFLITKVPNHRVPNYKVSNQKVPKVTKILMLQSS
jgi:hypothetical protein